MADTVNNNLYYQQNNLLVAGDLHVHTCERSTERQEDFTEDILTNMIFSKIFDTNQKLLRLRQELANSIDLGSFTPLYTGTVALDRPKIDPQMKNEWFFILAALKDANVLRSKPVKDHEFIEQMFAFFPCLPNLDFTTVDDYKKGMRQFTQSISVERRKWKVKGEVVRLVDLLAKQKHLTQLSEEKLSRIHRIAFPLYTALCNLVKELKGI